LSGLLRAIFYVKVQPRAAAGREASMRYIFMDNYRGFSEALIPLSRTTFLVGENSTGKSSFLTLAHELAGPDIFFRPAASGTAFSGLGGFRDIVSVTSPDRTYFAVGQLRTRNGGGGRRSASTFFIIRYKDEEGLPRVSKYISYSNNRLVIVAFENGETFYAVRSGDRLPDANIENPEKFFLETYAKEMGRSEGLQPFPAKIPPYGPFPVLLAMLGTFEQEGKIDLEKSKFMIEIPDDFISSARTWFAPIRTKPKRIYEGFKTEFSPEGDHIPYVIRRSLASREEAEKFTRVITTFGQSSGLFSTVKAHSFARDPSAPFEVIIGLRGKPLNISNVGYGVSQVLPVIVEMIASPKGHSFAIQQPEVHLHPRAQAALGGLLHSLVVEHKHRLIVETHSDYLIDRFRVMIKNTKQPKDAQVVFFSRNTRGNSFHVLPINEKGQYPSEQPDEFRRFFIDEELKLLEI